eukprot:TRINITY_DN27454_c0_g1_i1.p1 TRINITY_DN27454_c0_g1~~TRINITY_DN27454_c0_g1_i1.p1  ORF type:complete len:558 (-),score=86.18 TRINITY_DN27454_c0_g1_i1:80-1609(-)
MALWSLLPLLMPVFAFDENSAAGPAAMYLSDDFFPGMHILEKVEGSDGLFNVYWQAQRPQQGSIPPTVDLSKGTLPEARVALQLHLKIPEREPLQSQWDLFTHKGKRIKDVKLLKKASLVFVLEIGQWMWPPVRIGFEQNISDIGADGGSVTLRTLSVRPVVFEVRDFMTEAETDKVMAIGRSQGLHSSKGILQSADREKGTAHESFRTSKQAWLGNELDPLIKVLDQRTASLTRVPASHNEPVQLLRYDTGKYYHSHMDWTELDLYPDQKSVWIDSHFGHQDRLATVFWYLNDVAEGGETVFPKHGQPICSPNSSGSAQVRTCPGAEDPDMKSCDRGLKVKPKRGSVILWYNFLATGRGDRNALHGGCPVGENLTKWSGNKWVRIKPLHKPGRWIDNHPALARYGWTLGDTGAKDPNSCAVTFTNEAEEDVSLMFINEDGAAQVVGEVKAGQSQSMASFRGHQFQVRSSSGRVSGVVVCYPPASSFTLSSSFKFSYTGAAGHTDHAEL